jgi:hypothetical protein
VQVQRRDVHIIDRVDVDRASEVVIRVSRGPRHVGAVSCREHAHRDVKAPTENLEHLQHSFVDDTCCDVLASELREGDVGVVENLAWRHLRLRHSRRHLGHPIRRGERRDLIDVDRVVVVVPQRAAKAHRVTGPVGAEVVSRAEDRVLEIIGPRATVAVGVDPVGGEGGRHELHRTLRTGRRGRRSAPEARLGLVHRGEKRPVHALAAGGRGPIERQQVFWDLLGGPPRGRRLVAPTI